MALLIILNIVTGIGFTIIMGVADKVDRIDRDVSALIQKVGGLNR